MVWSRRGTWATVHEGTCPWTATGSLRRRGVTPQCWPWSFRSTSGHAKTILARSCVRRLVLRHSTHRYHRSVLVVHLLWTSDNDGKLLLWGEDGELPSAGPAIRGRRPATAPAPPHPFAADRSTLLAALTEAAPALHGALVDGEKATAVVWLPGSASAPQASPHLIRASDDGRKPRRTKVLWPFEISVLQLSPSAGLDVASVLSTLATSDLHVGASGETFSLLSALALEMVAAGRVLPNLRVTPAGHQARWEPVLNGRDEERLGALARSLPPVCRSLTAEGQSSDAIVRGALGAFVDAVCRDSLVGSRGALIRLPRRGSDTASSATESWVIALSSGSPNVIGEPAELAELEALMAEWRRRCRRPKWPLAVVPPPARACRRRRR